MEAMAEVEAMAEATVEVGILETAPGSQTTSCFCH